MKTKIEQEASQSTLRPETPLTHATDRRRLERAFLNGAKALKSHLDRETERLVRNVSSGKSDFEKGQLDGILWLQSCIDELFNRE
jgi:hypothetical protein